MTQNRSIISPLFDPFFHVSTLKVLENGDWKSSIFITTFHQKAFYTFKFSLLSRHRYSLLVQSTSFAQTRIIDKDLSCKLASCLLLFIIKQPKKLKD